MICSGQPISRRAFLKSAAAATGSILLAHSARSAAPATAPGGTSSPDARSTGIIGVALVTSIQNEADRIDLVSLKDARILATFEDIHASHAVVPIEGLNCFFVHGRHGRTGKGLIWGVEVNPKTEAWRVIFDRQLDGGLVLHWQPNADASLILYNTVADQSLHVLNTHTLDLQTYEGGGTHSNMAFYGDDRWLVATDHLGDGTRLRVVDRSSHRVLSETGVGSWGHGVTVDAASERAFVWAAEGMHMVSLRKKNLGAHLGVIGTADPGQRSWFCWTPLGLGFSHDQTWNPGDRYSPWLTVVDLKKCRIERIETGSELPGILQVSPDGRVGASGSLSSENICLFDLQANRLIGTVSAGRRNNGFFDRDASFSRDRRLAFVTNPADRTMSVIDIAARAVIRELPLPATPRWMKVLT